MLNATANKTGLLNSKHSVKGTNIGNTLGFLVSFQARNIIKQKRQETAKWTKEQLIELGPTFIKIGQFVSSRSDIFDQEVIDELQTLQDKAPPFDALEAKQIISNELGMPYDEVFSEFDEVPVASASISQVHRAKLASTGQEVVVKVQRPYIKEMFDRDFKTLQTILNIASISNSRTINDSKMLLDDCYEFMYEELSFENELSNLLTFRKIFRHNADIVIPEPFVQYCTSKILTMEYIPSMKMNNTKGFDKPLLATQLMECFIKQIVDYGVIHADPHPGNVGITKDGKIVLYDFGQVAKLDDLLASSVKTLLFSVYERDVVYVTDILIKTKAIIPLGSTDKKSIRKFIEQVIVYFETVDFKEFQLSMLDNMELGFELPFKINSKLVMVFRSLSLLEGICKELDPEFSYFKVIDLLMSDVFLDMDYINHRARKDFLTIFDTSTNSQMEVFQNTLEANNKSYIKEVNTRMKEYEQLLYVLLGFSVLDVHNIPRTVLMGIAFAFVVLKKK